MHVVNIVHTVIVRHSFDGALSHRRRREILRNVEWRVLVEPTEPRTIVTVKGLADDAMRCSRKLVDFLMKLHVKTVRRPLQPVVHGFAVYGHVPLWCDYMQRGHLNVRVQVVADFALVRRKLEDDGPRTLCTAAIHHFERVLMFVESIRIVRYVEPTPPVRHHSKVSFCNERSMDDESLQTEG